MEGRQVWNPGGQKCVFFRGASLPCLLAVGISEKCLFCRSKAPRADAKCCGDSARQAPGPQKCCRKRRKCTRSAFRRSCSRFSAENAILKTVGQFWRSETRVSVQRRGIPSWRKSVPMERGGSSCCGAVEEGGRGRADGRQMGAALGEMRATYARKCSQSMPWLKMHGNLRRIGPRKTNGYFFARN